MASTCFLNISASPFTIGKQRERAALIRTSCIEHSVPFVIVNQVGANTELIFDGGSGVFGADGEPDVLARPFAEDLIFWDTHVDSASDSRIEQERRPRHDLDDLFDALVLGIRDYYEKTGAFEQALVGLSGGIDSAVTASLAVEALGPGRVVGVSMPSRYSSEGSVSDAVDLASNLGIRLYHIPIEPAVTGFESMLAEVFSGTAPGIAEENIQARTRGTTLMALSNKFSTLLLTTGNKSEMAVGYATLYGDMNGGLAVLADVLKTQVFALAEYINERAEREVIPRSTIEKPPSAELRPDQKDSDSLPEYEVARRDPASIH